MKLMAFGLVGLLGALGCDKGTSGNGRVEVSPDEAAMLAHLPAKNVVLFGGNFVRFQKFLSDSSLDPLLSSLTQSAGPGMKEWMSCYSEAKNLKALGAIKLDAGHVDMESVLSGMDLSQLEACAKRASFPTTLDADHKFLGIELPTPQGSMKTGYLVLPDGMLYTRASAQFPVTSVAPIDRAALEQDIASIAKVGSAATDKVLVDQIAGVDRTKAVWFVGNAAGTPIADKVGNAQGTLDFGNQLAFDITVQVVDKKLADNIADGIPEARQQSAMLGSAVKAVADKLVFNRSGDRLRFRLAVDIAQLRAMGDELAPFAKAQGMSGVP